jgi:hypothetical protein
MITITIIAIVVMIISSIISVIIFYNFCKTNNFFGLILVRNRRNRISPEMYHVLARILREREENMINEYQYNRDREIEMIEYNKRDKVIIINPNNNIEIGIGKK